MRVADVILLESRLRRALEPLFRACAANDLFTLAEAKAGLLHAECLPQLLKASVESLDLVLDGRVEPFGEEVPELLPLFREPLDLGM